MALKIHLIILSCLFTIISYSQENKERALFKLGDTAPELNLREWLKGDVVKQFENGHFYVIEFWATWCKPCIAAMPHLSDFASRYKGKVSVIGVNVYEKENTSDQQIRDFVEMMGDKMNYHVAIDDRNKMVDQWIVATEGKEAGIPRSFVVNAEGKLAWIGHPKDLDLVMAKIVNGNWNIEEESTRRNEQKRLDILEREASYTLRQYMYDLDILDLIEKPDSILKKVLEIVSIEPKLKDTGVIAFYTFSSLLKIDQEKACDYAELLIGRPSNLYNEVCESIREYSDKIEIFPKTYNLASKALEKQIDNIVYPELVDVAAAYAELAQWFWKSGDKANALANQEKSIMFLKNQKDFLRSDLIKLETQLQQYKEMDSVVK